MPMPVSALLADYVSRFRYDDIPAAVRERARYLILDAVGVAIAAGSDAFAQQTLASLEAIGERGNCSVIGLNRRLPLRDSVLMNGMLVHGIDFDDTHLDGVVHPSASALPCALSLAEHLGVSGRDLLAAYILGVEVVTRIGMSTGYGFHRYGFHPTGLLGHFSCSLQAGWLLNLSPEQLTMAQGIVGSTAAASQEFLADGAWNKRMHPGWAGTAGITAAYLARGGFISTQKTYEGRFGLFKSHLHDDEVHVRYGRIVTGLGEVWELANTSLKPYPICHFLHACAESAIELARRYRVQAEDIERIRVLLPKEGLPVVAEPEAAKIAPVTPYEAQFSAPFVVAASLLSGRFGLAELQQDVLSDPRVLALARKVKCTADPASSFPTYYSGGVAITTRGGDELRHHVAVNAGAGERALTGAEIESKFMSNAEIVIRRAPALAVRDCILGIETHSAPEIARTLTAVAIA